MTHLLCELVFIDSDCEGRECHRTFPVGTPVTEAREGDLKWSEEIAIIESRIRDNARRKDPDFYCMFLGGRPRLLHRRFWDPSFDAKQQLSEKVKQQSAELYRRAVERGEHEQERYRILKPDGPVIATAEPESEGRNPATILDDETAQLGGRNDTDHVLERLIPASAPVPGCDLINHSQDGIFTTIHPVKAPDCDVPAAVISQGPNEQTPELVGSDPPERLATASAGAPPVHDQSAPRSPDARFGTTVGMEADSPQGCQPPEEIGLRPVQAYGLVVVVDLLNLLVRAFHAGPPSKINGVKSLLLTCGNIIEKLSPEYLIFAADGGHAERSAACPAYKAHRPPKPPELVAQISLAERVISLIGWPIVRVKHWEADDVIASLAETVAPVAAGFVVCSCDKDLLQLLVKTETDGTIVTNGLSAPFGLSHKSHTSHQSHSSNVKIYHPWDGGKFLGQRHITEKYAIKPHQFADYLALVGDASDGIPGVKGIGPKKAAELLATYPDLGSILEAARCVFIKGSAGKTLAEQSDAARMSRRLVELNRRLQIPTDWHDTPATSPTAGWIDALRSNDLGSVVNRLCDVLPVSGRVRSRSSLIEVTNEQPSLYNAPAAGPATVSSSRAVPTESHTGDVDTQRRAVSGDRLQDDRKSSDAGRSGDGPTGRMGQGIPEQKMDVPPSSGQPWDFSGTSWIDEFPVLAKLPGNCPAEITCRSVYADIFRDVRRGRVDGLNPWKIGSDLSAAWNLGNNQEPFRWPVQVAESELQPMLTPVTSENREKQPQKSLF